MMQVSLDPVAIIVKKKKKSCSGGGRCVVVRWACRGAGLWEDDWEARRRFSFVPPMAWWWFRGRFKVNDDRPGGPLYPTLSPLYSSPAPACALAPQVLSGRVMVSQLVHCHRVTLPASPSGELHIRQGLLSGQGL